MSGTTNIAAETAWDGLLRAAENWLESAKAEEVCEFDAERLERMARQVRSLLADAKCRHDVVHRGQGKVHGAPLVGSGGKDAAKD